MTAEHRRALKAPWHVGPTWRWQDVRTFPKYLVREAGIERAGCMPFPSGGGAAGHQVATKDTSGKDGEALRCV